MSIRDEQRSVTTSRVYHAKRFNDEARARYGGRPASRPRSGESLQSVRRRGAGVYLLGMFLVTGIGSAFVIGGMLAEATGLAAVALAAAMPVAGLLFAITLSVMSRN